MYARRFLPLWTAALAGILTALAWQTVAHGSELRAYSLLALLTLGFALLLERAAANPLLGRLVALGACAAAGAYTHYFFLLAAIAGLIWLAVERELRAVALRVGSAIVLGSATLLAWLPGLLDQVGAERFGWIDVFDPVKFASLPSALFWDPGTMYAELGADPGVWEVTVRVAILALVLGGCAVLRHLGSSARLCALLVVVPIGVSGIAWLAGLRIITGRNLIGVTAFAAIALAAVLLPLPRRAAFGAAALGVALAVFWYVRTPMPERPDFDQVADALVDAGWAPGDPILVVGSLPDFRSPLEWYLPGDVTLPEAAPREACAEVWVVTDVPRGATCSTLPRRRAARTWEPSRSPASPGTAAWSARPRPAAAATWTPRPAPAACGRSRTARSDRWGGAAQRDLGYARLMSIPVFAARHVYAAVDPSDAVEAVREAFVAHARGEWLMPSKVYVPVPPDGDFRAMPARGGGYAVLKWVTSFPRNPERGLPTVAGVALLSDATDGRLLAELDAGALTALRTGAAAVLAAETLAAGDGPAAVIGCGVNGRAVARTFLARGRKSSSGTRIPTAPLRWPGSSARGSPPPARKHSPPTSSPPSRPAARSSSGREACAQASTSA